MGSSSPPGIIRRFLLRQIAGRPKRANRTMGSVVVTNVSMMGGAKGWFIQRTIHPLSIGIGSIVKKPIIKDGDVVAGEVVHMSVIMDHDVIDGAPMARFIDDLTATIESGRLDEKT